MEGLVATGKRRGAVMFYGVCNDSVRVFVSEGWKAWSQTGDDRGERMKIPEKSLPGTGRERVRNESSEREGPLQPVR